jgi:hypothetical protein
MGAKVLQIAALQGPAAIREGDRIGLLRLLDNVSRRVADAADEQHPAIRGTFDGEYSWPVMSPGPTYQAAFPEYGTPVTAADIASLAAFGFRRLWLTRGPATFQT